ncbi:hypothetical protein HD806DRAFT_505893 [Xylariaceae sp. AK1471]|nr:hypothetical protein HD806DRAFT_505893 [Xylariaceae sp. AK1471]
MYASLSPNNTSRMLVYFLRISRSNFMEDTEHPTYDMLAEVERESTTQVKLKVVVAFLPTSKMV